MISKGKQRIPWIDAVKLFAMLCVIFGHSTSILPQNIIGFHEINMAIVVFNMPLFVIMTGFMGYKNIIRIKDILSLENFILRNSERIALPAFSFTVLENIPGALFNSDFIKLCGYILVLCFIVIWYKCRFVGIINENLHKLLLATMLITAIFGLSKFWFLNMLVIILLITGIMLFLLKGSVCDKNFYTFLAATYILLFFVDWQWVSEMIVFYIIGLVLARFNLLDRLMVFLGEKASLKLIMVIIACLAIHVLIDPVDFYSNTFRELLLKYNFYAYPLRVLIGASIAISIILLFKEHYVKKGFFSFWGATTLGIYMIHAPFAELFRSHTIISFPEWYYWAVPFISTAFLLLFSICVIVVLRRYKLTSTIFLGDKY